MYRRRIRIPFSKTGEWEDPKQFPEALRRVGLGVESWQPQPFPKGAQGKKYYDAWVKRVLNLLRINPLCQCSNPDCLAIFAPKHFNLAGRRDKALCEKCKMRWRKRTDMTRVRNGWRVQVAMLCAEVWESCGERPKEYIAKQKHSKMVAEKANILGIERGYDWFTLISGKWVTWHLGWIRKALSEKRGEKV
jgi:hypothetical protein